MPSVPTKNSVTGSAKNGGMNGLAAGLGETVGRSVLGPGIGTAAGGILAGSMMSGNDRTLVSTLAVERGVNELFAGSASAAGGRQGAK